ncbi:MAG: phosphoribosylformylglycinamidine synthase subunit PurL [Bdellovibrionales bacterium]|nr:phosphoribosylformylglycinamidine synthase subunit PurL [Bdellovibrionales bacterium]
MTEQELADKLKKYRLSRGEYGMMQKLLGRDPQGVEWALFSALWSEHCSYKSSRVHLKKFAFRSSRVLQSMGENAGVIDLGHGEKVAFKMESHNHPSFIEPYQGAATGVGGILRDIFTMGARPIALANYLCFGRPQAERMSAIVDGVVAGISGYGNCVGVPTVTGQTEFHESYDKNVLVNALAVGLFTESDPIVTSNARGVGNLVVYVGAKTGRDGVHGASMASEAFGEDSASKRPTVQIGDPFYEKLLIESCLEVMKENLVVAIQDMGAAGITSSSFEMAAKGGVGLRLHLDQVPLRDSSVGPEEILLSESQERMLLVCEPKKLEAIQEVFHRWGLDASVLGEVIKGPEIELFWKKDLICKIDPKLLTDHAPMYERPYEPWVPKRKRDALETTALKLEELLSSAEGCSRRWIYQQYDQRVGAKTVRDCDDSIAIQRLPSGRGLGLVLGCRPSLMRVDAQLGGYDAAFYPSLELAAKGFQPLALTDCLNFGNPEKPEIMGEFVAAVEALADASKLMNAPVISGNVSFYNETLNRNITSTPATGVVGLRDSIEGIPRSQFVNDGDEIVLWRLPAVKFTSDQFGREAAFSGALDPEMTSRWLMEVFQMGLSKHVSASRVVGKFGLGYALYRMCGEELGAKVATGAWAEAPGDFYQERLYEVLLSGPAGLLEEVTPRAGRTGSEAWKIGTVTKGVLSLGSDTKDLKGLHELYRSGWRKHFPGLS